MTTKPSFRLKLFDTLSRLNHAQASKLLGPECERLLTAGGSHDIDIATQVELGVDILRVAVGQATVTMTPSPAARGRLAWRCSECNVPCEHAGAAFSLVLEEKLALGLAGEPPAQDTASDASDEDLVAAAIRERKQRALTEKMRLVPADAREIWTDYTVTNAESGKSYRVALRGFDPGASYCSCPDYRKNTLGTCKHILHVLERVRRRFPASAQREPHKQRDIALHLAYGRELELRMLLPERLPRGASEIVRPLRDRPIADLPDLFDRVRRLEAKGLPVTLYPDAEEFIQARLFRQRMADLVAEIRRDPAAHPLRTTLLKAELLPHQVDGIAFAAGAGRAILADDMGLGKTIQGIGVAELLAREAAIRRVLIVCPATVKSQWRSEILRFSERDCQIVLGGAAERAAQYEGACFFTICNYEQVVRDIVAIERANWDLIVLDEGQRIKNWEAKTSRTIKSLRSPFALVLSGTPLENRLDDLYSVAQFIDDRRLGPAFRFFARHRVTDDRGKVVGYRNLDRLRESLMPLLLRRTRGDVMADLPERTTEIVRIAPTQEQLDIDGAQMQVVSTIVRKKYLTEMDLLRLRKALLLARMNADSTALVDKRAPGHSTKLECLEQLLAGLAAEESRKIVLFSEWTTMLDLIEQRIAGLGLGSVRLDGSVPQKQRQQIVHRFQHDPACRLFMTTNAGSTGLNLQAADTVVNVDLPWNPAVLEQRIARAHRMGQRNPVQVYVLVTEDTFEEKLLATLSGKHELALAVLDMESDVTEVALTSGIEELRRRLEVLLGAKPHAAVDRTELQRQQQETERLARRERVAEAGGRLLAAAFTLMGELLPQRESTAASAQLASDLEARLGECLEHDDSGRPRLTVTLPDAAALGQLARSLASMLA